MIKLSPSYLVLDSLNKNLNADKVHEGQLSKSRGILAQTPLLNMPRSHSILDEVAAELPNLLSVYKERKAIDAIPMLDYTEHGLEEVFLSRASTIICNLVHAYYYNNPKDTPLPLPMQIAFKSVTKRIGRKIPYRGMFDAFYYNWKHRNPNNIEMSFDTLDLLVPVFGDESERIFHLSVILSDYHFAEALSFITLAQNAILNNDNILLAECIDKISDVLSKIVEHVLMKVSFNPSSGYYMNPILWGRTFAIIAQPRFKEEIGLSGVASPMFHILDGFMGRKTYDTNMGRQLTDKHGFMPKNIVSFINAVSQVSLVDYIKKENNIKLTRSFQKLMSVYLGENGWLGLHKRKVFGVMQLVFKAGRLVTNGGEEGEPIGHIGVEKLDQDLGKSIEEREVLKNTCPFATKVGIKKLSKTSTILELDITNAKISMLPGDKISLIPKNTSNIINNILDLIQVQESQSIHLNDQWSSALARRNIKSPVINIITFLSFIETRQLPEHTIDSMISYFDLNTLLRHEELVNYDLYDFLLLIKNLGKDIRDLFLSKKDGYSMICDFSTPIIPRTYSISNIRYNKASIIDLSIKKTSYTTTVQNKLRQLKKIKKQGLITQLLLKDNFQTNVLVHHIPSFHFRLNTKKVDTIVMFAAGIGISPFLSFLRAREFNNIKKNVLFYSIRNLEEFHYQKEIVSLVKSGYLKLYLSITCSRDIYSELRHANIVVKYSRINNFFVNTAYINYVKNTLRGDTYLYICGNEGFNNLVIKNIKNIIIPTQKFYELIAEKKICAEVFTNKNKTQKLPTINYSLLSSKNNKQDGFWIAIEGSVYDITEYIHIHPGGKEILCSIAGMVGDYYYRKVHSQNSEADGWLGMYKIGRLVTYQNSEFYTKWIQALNIIVEVQNIYRNNTNFTSIINPPSYLASFNYDNFLEAHFLYIIKALESLYGYVLKKFNFNKYENYSFRMNNQRSNFSDTVLCTLSKYNSKYLDTIQVNKFLNKLYGKANDQILACIQLIKIVFIDAVKVIEEHIKINSDISCHNMNANYITSLLLSILSTCDEQYRILFNMKSMLIKELNTFCQKI